MVQGSGAVCFLCEINMVKVQVQKINSNKAEVLVLVTSTSTGQTGGHRYCNRYLREEYYLRGSQG